MKRQRRQNRILELLASADFHGVASLAQMLDVSEETIRREIRKLEADGLVARAHGVVRLARLETEGSFALRLQRNTHAKQRIATAAASFVADGQTLYIDASTTGHYVAQALRDRQRLSVITNAVGVATELGGRNDNRILLAGGEMDYDYRACFDAPALAYMAQFTPSLAIMSVESMHLDNGYTSYHAGEAAACRLMVQQARRVMMAIDASKFDRHGMIAVAGFDAVDVLVSDQPAPPPMPGCWREPNRSSPEHRAGAPASPRSRRPSPRSRRPSPARPGGRDAGTLAAPSPRDPCHDRQDGEQSVRRREPDRKDVGHLFIGAEADDRGDPPDRHRPSSCGRRHRPGGSRRGAAA